MFLTIAMAPPNSLFYALRIPREVVVHHQVAELQVHPLCCGFSRNHNRCVVAEAFHEGGPHVGAGRSADAIRPCVPLYPPTVNCFGKVIGVCAIEQDDLVFELGLLKNTQQVVLRTTRFSEDYGLLLESRCIFWALSFPCRLEAASQGHEQHFAL